MTISYANGTAFETFGDSSHPAIILIHGLGLTRQTFSEFIPALAEDYFVVTYDLLGHGQTALPESIVSLTSLSNQLLALMDHLTIADAHIIGFSLGGMINRRFAIDNPQRVSSLIILNSPHERSKEEQEAVEKRATDTSQGGISATIETTLQRWFTNDFITSHPQIVEWVRQTVLANHFENYVAHRFVLAAGVKELIAPKPAITHRTLIITCQNDSGSSPQMAEQIHNEIAGSELLIINDLQHLGLLERPQAFTDAILSFLRSHIS